MSLRLPATALAILLTLTAFAPESPGQSILRAAGGPIQFNPNRFGDQVSLIGDVDGDGLSEFAVSAFSEDTVATNGGSITVYSGATGVILLDLFGSSGELLGESLRRVGDVNGDGAADILTGSSGFVRVYSGADGSVLHDLPIVGWEVAGIGDFDGDGRDDFMVSSLDRITLYSGSNAAVLRDWHKPGIPFASDIDAVGDVNGDGVVDIVTGYETASHDSMGSVGAAFVLSGATGAVIHRFAGDEESDRFGTRVRGVGDIDADGVPDIGVGAQEVRPDPPFASTNFGYVRIFSGSTGEMLHEVRPVRNDGDPWAWYLSGIGDVNLDGHDDFAVGSPRALGGGLVRIFSGRTGERILTVRPAYSDINGLGSDVDGRYDVNGDGRADLFFGAPGSGFGNAGRAFVYDGACFDVRSFCESLPNSSGNAARIFVDGLTSIFDDQFALEAESGPPGKAAIVFFGDQSTQVPFGDGFRCVGGSVTAQRGQVSTFGALGRLRREVSLSTGPLGTVSPGDTLMFQFWFRDPTGPGGNGFNLTNGVSVTFCQ